MHVGVHSVRFSPGPFCLWFSGTHHVWNNACERATVDPSGTYPPGLKRSLRRGAQVVPSAWKPQKFKLNTWWIGGWLVRPKRTDSRDYFLWKPSWPSSGTSFPGRAGWLQVFFSFIPVHTSYPKFETHLWNLFEFTKMENPKCWLGLKMRSPESFRLKKKPYFWSKQKAIRPEKSGKAWKNRQIQTNHKNLQKDRQFPTVNLTNTD